MKKISKKQKLIGAVALIIIATILAIVITTNIVKNGQVASEGYYATTSNAGSNLIANYILNGITIGGITGKMEVLDTSDASAIDKDIEYGKIAYARGERIVGTRIFPTTSLNPDEVYYADIEGDGEVDGVIFVDLAVGGSGQWKHNWGKYEITTENGFKNYYIIKENYTDDFGTGKVIAPLEGTSGNNRFYVMTLEDFGSRSYYWYYNATFDKNYNKSPTLQDFGTGKENTERMITNWNTEQWGNKNENDILGLIQGEVNEGWTIPSQSEWAAFASKFNISDNYSNYNLTGKYWSSSQGGTYAVYCINFSRGIIEYGNIDEESNYVRLRTTF